MESPPLIAPEAALGRAVRLGTWIVTVVAASTALAAAGSGKATVVLPVTVTTALPAGQIPMDVEVDFAAILRKAELPGVFDPNTVELTNLATGAREPHALSPHVAYGDRARVRWLVTSPADKNFEIRFTTAQQRPVLRPRADTPLIGVGDLLRYTGAQPRPIASSLATRLVDLNGDGVPDLVGTDYYTTEPLWPERIPDSWSPFLCHPGVQDGDRLLFGNAVRLRYCDTPDAPSRFFLGGYMHADVADVNGDALPDLAFAAAARRWPSTRRFAAATSRHRSSAIGTATANGISFMAAASAGCACSSTKARMRSPVLRPDSMPCPKANRSICT